VVTPDPESTGGGGGVKNEDDQRRRPIDEQSRGSMTREERNSAEQRKNGDSVQVQHQERLLGRKENLTLVCGSDTML
jgi:hypothetical protein